MKREPWACPKGAARYSQHQFVEIRRKKIANGVFESTRKCKLCGKIDVATLDYVVLNDLFPAQPRKRKS